MSAWTQREQSQLQLEKSTVEAATRQWQDALLELRQEKERFEARRQLEEQRWLQSKVCSEVDMGAGVGAWVRACQ